MNRAMWTLRSRSLCPLLAQDARQIVEEAQRRGKVNSQRYEGVLEVTAADGKVTRKSWQTCAPRLVRQQQSW